MPLSDEIYNLELDFFNVNGVVYYPETARSRVRAAGSMNFPKKKKDSRFIEVKSGKSEEERKGIWLLFFQEKRRRNQAIARKSWDLFSLALGLWSEHAREEKRFKSYAAVISGRLICKKFL